MLSVGLLARAMEIHDAVTANHIARVREYSFLLATLSGQPREFCERIRDSAQLHDVGKMSIDAAILRKRGQLSAAEWAEMRNHPIFGHRTLAGAPELAMAAEIALHHHERWDGSGYPYGLAGEAIPLSARIVALADIYDALRSRRPYKASMSHTQALRVMLDGDERIDPQRHFDPQLLARFSDHHEAFEDIWNRFGD